MTQGVHVTHEALFVLFILVMALSILGVFIAIIKTIAHMQDNGCIDPDCDCRERMK